MKTTFTILVVLFFVQIGFSQSMVVNKNDGGKATFPLSEIKNITFEISQIPTNGLVAYYPFNGNANDESGNNNNGTVYGEALRINDRKGNANKAYSFDGVNDYIDLGNKILDAKPISFTVCMWINFPEQQLNSQHWASIITRRNLESQSWAALKVWYDNSQNNLGKATISVDYPDYHSSTQVRSTTKVINNAWHFIVGTKNGNTYQIFVDGIKEGEGVDGQEFESDDHFFLMFDNPWKFYSKGMLDDIRIYNRLLTEQEIQLLYKE